MRSVHHLAVVLAIGVSTLVLAVLLPIEANQGLLWGTAFLVFVVGDSVTTSLIQRHERLVEAGPLTRRLCGRNPSVGCATGTRIIFFGVLLLPYLAVTQTGLGSAPRILVISAVLLPLIVTVSGVFVLLWNTYGLLDAEISA